MQRNKAVVPLKRGTGRGGGVCQVEGAEMPVCRFKLNLCLVKPKLYHSGLSKTSTIILKQTRK